MTVLSDICTLGPYVLDITELSPAILADGDLLSLSYDNDINTIRFPKFRYIVTMACNGAECPYPSDFSGETNVDLIISFEFQQRIRDQWRTYSLSNFNFTQRRLLSYYPMSDTDCPNTPSLDAMIMWRTYISDLALANPSNDSLTEFSANLITGECVPDTGFKSFTLDLTLPPSVPYYSQMFITEEKDGSWWNGVPHAGTYQEQPQEYLDGTYNRTYAIGRNSTSIRLRIGENIVGVSSGGYYEGYHIPAYSYGDGTEIPEDNTLTWIPIEIKFYSLSVTQDALDLINEEQWSQSTLRDYTVNNGEIQEAIWNMHLYAYSGYPDYKTLAETDIIEAELAYPNYWTPADLGTFDTV